MYGPTHATFAQQVDGTDLPLAGAATGTGDQAGAQVADLLGAEPGIGDGIAHGQVGEGRRVAHEALLLAVDQRVQIEVDTTTDLAAQARFGVVGQGGDARAPFAQRSETVSRSLPRQDVMPMPVMTTRRIRSSRFQ